MYSRTSNRSRVLLILLIILAAVIITFYYRGGTGLLRDSQRIALTAIAPLQRGVNAAVEPFRRVSRYTVRLSRATAESRQLKAENVALIKENNRLRRYRVENKRLRELAGFRAESEFKTKAAHVVSRSPNSWQSLATIDFGSADGAKRRLSVITEKGLVGQITAVTAGSSIVQLADDRRSGVAVEIERTGGTGVVEGRMNGDLRLRFVSDYEDIKKGDLVVTSGVGGVYPRGIPVGTVAGLSKNVYSLEEQISLKPAVDYRRLSEVLVIVDRSESGAR
jgi:rod shape-determining protein MreC